MKTVKTFPGNSFLSFFSHFFILHLLMFIFIFSGEKLTIKELSRMMKIMDEDSNGVISFDEFVKGVYDFVVSRKPIIDDNHKNVSQKSPSTTDSEGFIDSMEREGKEEQR